MFPYTPYFGVPASPATSAYPHPGARGFATASQPQPPFYYGLPTAASDDFATLQDEERAALAHLRAIQRRREEAESAAFAHQAAIRAEAEARREAAIRAELARAEREAQVKAMLRARQAEDERRQRAYFEFVEQKRLQQAAAQRQRQQAIEAQRQACAARCQRRPSASAARSDDAEWQNFNNLLGSLFGVSVSPDTEPTTTTESEQPKPATAQPELKQASAHPTTPATPAASTSAKEAFPEEINDLLGKFLGLRVDPLNKSDNTEITDNVKDNGVPQGLNEFLNQFGLVFEPEQESPKEESPATSTAAVAAAVAETESKPEPNVTSANASATASSSAPSAADKQKQQDVPPFTALLEQFADINPFVRDILGNIEHHFTDELRRKSDNGEDKPQCERRCAKPCQTACAAKVKGKGRAEGERVEVPKSAPAPAPTAAPAQTETTESDTTSSSLSTLDSIESQLSTLQSSFTFPEKLAFAQTSQENSAAPLLFNKVNSSYHAQAHALLQLLLKADGVASNGEREVRKRRKQVVRAVEQEIENLEQKRDGLWEQVKERRQRGEESEPEDDGRSWTEASSSVGDHEHLEQEHEHEQDVEHIEHVTPAEDSTEPDTKDHTPAAVQVEDKQKQTSASADIPTETEPKSYADIAKASEGVEETSESTPVPAPVTAAPSAEPEAEGYTISVTFPPEPAAPAEGSTEKPEDQKAEDRSAKVQDETKEEGYEML
ncbi:hypothetical protein IAU60_000429 [Kwoniella sp. DSM 27419]